MSSVGPYGSRPMPYSGEEWRGGESRPARRQDESNIPWGLIVTGLVAVGLGVMAWQYIGPDVRRYMKMRSM